MNAIATRLDRLQQRIAAASRRAGRSPDAVHLLAVSKTFAPQHVLEAAQAGQRAFGENRVQEAVPKIQAVNQASPWPLEWHSIGRLQRNKVRRAVAAFDVIHSVDRIELAHAIETAAKHLDRHPTILLQVDIDGEPQKGGIAPGEVADLLAAVAALDRVRVIGLMAIPRACEDPEEVRPSFARLRALRDELRQRHPAGRRLTELSMGMSADFEIAIEEGATWIRVGSALFGERGSQ